MQESQNSQTDQKIQEEPKSNEQQNQTKEFEKSNNQKEIITNEKPVKAQENTPKTEQKIEPIQETPTKKNSIQEKVEQIKKEALNAFTKYSDNLSEFENKSADLASQENKIIKSTINKTLSLFKELNVENLGTIDTRLNEVKLENKEELMHIKHPSKGRGKGFFWGIVIAAGSFVGLGVYGAKLANLPLNTQTFMQKANLDNIALIYANMVNLAKNPIYGYLVMAIISVILGLIIYKLITFLQKLKNIKTVNKLEEETKTYQANLEEKILNIKEMLTHLDKVQLVNKKYDVILQEQNAKIKRMLFIEQPKELNDLHKTSQLEVEKTILIVDELIKLMDTPVSKNDKLNPENVTNLTSANTVINEVIKKLY